MKKFFVLFLIFGLFGLIGCTNKYAAYAGTYSLYDAAGQYYLSDFQEYTIVLSAQGEAEITAVTSYMEGGQYQGTHDIYEYRIEDRKIIFWNDQTPEFEQRYEDGQIIVENFSYENGTSTLWFRKDS